MKILAQTEYQDLYRVTDGVLFVVNKFVPIEYEGVSNLYIYSTKLKQGKYNKNCQDWLKVLKEDYCYNSITVPKGTVLYMNRPVIATTNEADFNYEIKTTGSAFSGNVEVMENMLSDILYRIRQGKIRI